MSEQDAAGPGLAKKKQELGGLLSALGGAFVAFSGGVDSSYLLSMCIDVLGADRVIAITADSPLLPRAELATARQVAALLGARHQIVPLNDLAIPEVAANPPLRCYYCKRKRFEALLALVTRAEGYTLLHGENADDHLDYRPGSRAAQELGVRAPLAEANMTKADIRHLSHERGLPTWNQPSAACLASRFPYHTPLTREGLERVEQAELLLERLLPSCQIRLRDHFPVARIEVPPSEIAGLAQPEIRAQVTQGIRNLGYRYVTLDLDGYRMGSLNADIES
jgi:uncharacterized protein